MKMRLMGGVLFAAVFSFAVRSAAAAPEQQTVLSVESDALRLVISADACASGFIDKAAGVNYADLQARPVFVCVKRAGKNLRATKASLVDGALQFGFEDPGVGVTLKLTGAGHSIAVEVLSVTGEGVGECAFAQLPLALKDPQAGPFAACALALNLQTKVSGLPQATNFLDARCYQRFGFVGAKVALIGCPPKELRRVLQKVLTAAPELPLSPIGGPWALDAEINRGSYLFASIGEANADERIQMAKNLGINQIDFDHMSRYGDAEPLPNLYPNGRAGLKAVVEKVQAAGLKAGLHSYGFFIDKRCPWVTPVPDARLAKDATFTLAEPLDAEGLTVTVSEPTANMSAVTGFHIRNSATLHVDDELIVYTDVSKTPPYAFTKCKRGAYGTHIAPHAKGAKVQHLKECFGHFVPDHHSTLFVEIVARQAQMVNECGFDMMYLDALDGSDILAGREDSWYYGSKFVYELWKRFDHPVLLEMSTMHHHLWCVRSRIGAWDYPTRSHKWFIGLHCSENLKRESIFLPTNLGWWSLQTWSGIQGEPTFSDDIEYLCGKAAGSDVGISLQSIGVAPDKYAQNAGVKRLGDIMRDYEALRHAKAFSESIKARLRVRGDEFTLDRKSDKDWRLRPARYDKHKVEFLDSTSATWSVTNAFEKQPLRLRLEALMSVESYDSPKAITMAGFTNQAEFAWTNRAPGVKASLASTAEPVKAGALIGASIGVLTASNTRPVRNATWACFGKTFEPTLNLGGERALGVWVHGDGQGEVLNLQLQSPIHISGACSEHYIVVDFTGWRYFERVESEGERYASYSWPYGHIYSIYRQRISFGQIEKMAVWINNLPANGTATCLISPVHALPLVKAKIRNPRVTVDGRTLLFPGEIESGSYLEFNLPGDCKVFGTDGNLLREVKVAEDVPVLEPGKNQLHFECDRDPGVNPRVRITTITTGAPLPQ